MGIFDRLRGGKKEAAEEPSALNDAAAAAAVSPTLDLTEHASASSQTDASAKVLSFDKSEATRLYNPYDGEPLSALQPPKSSILHRRSPHVNPLTL
jgi:hypothetical protein